MDRLTGKDLRKISAFLRELYQLRTHEEFTTHIIAAIPTITDGLFTSYNEFPHAGTPGLAKSDQAPHCPNPEYYASVICRYADQHPFLTHVQKTKDGRAKTFSDFLPARAFRETPLYHEFYQPLRIPYLLVMALTVDKRLITISRHRDGHEFDQRTRAIFDAIRPHLQQALRNALAVTQRQDHLAALDQAMEANHQAMMSVTGDGRIRLSTPLVHQLFARYGFRARRGADWLPPSLRAWLRGQIERLSSSDDVAPPLSPLAIAGKTGTLHIRLAPQDPHYLLLLQEEPRALAPNLAHLGLSRRETEILSWVIQGKTNPEIGAILGISPRTVQKHLERLYGHLGVENRHAAMRIAIDAVHRDRF